MSEPIDPNEAYEKKVGPDHPTVSEDEAWGTKQNPVRDDPEPFTGLRDGGTGK